ncbi:glycerol-3-phosphate acyltransferase [Meiothermus sp. CFH 77666]|uniref:glycerol-3-phosphate acyltransferase n=1 Tax=Meiothermus sp. CFH 77666 TaxID=2817942 RepID=UPI001AA06F27|nr:glycerol-3-phosphate acyltransferase [Meiothermus sp. CFH 77666]MBO1436711.1 glycerol-3-phosphate acyltransferase [Meiothermus sp. CFH 77666]
MEWVYAALAGYLFGSLPFAYWFGVLQNKNLLAEGSGNVGGTNAWRVLGPVPGLMVMTLDVTKGLMAVALGEFLVRDPAGGLLGGALAVLGHCYSVWLLGHGGKGIAPALGALFAINPWLLATAGGAFGLAYLLTRNPYRSVVLAALAFPVASSAVGGSLSYLWFGFGVAVPILLKHLGEWNRTPGQLHPGREPRNGRK